MDYLINGAGSGTPTGVCRGGDACTCFMGTLCTGVWCSGDFCDFCSLCITQCIGYCRTDCAGLCGLVGCAIMPFSI